MPSFIQEGDIVNIFYNDQESPTVGAKVLHAPTDTGDMWYFQQGGYVFAQNPQSSNLDFIRKVVS